MLIGCGSDADWMRIGRGLDADWTQIGCGLDVDWTRIGCGLGADCEACARNAPGIEKGQLLIELGSLDDIPLEAIIEVAAKMREKASFLPRTVDFSRGGGKEIAGMLSNMSADEEEKYLQAIANEDPELHKEIKKYHLTFDDIIAKFPPDILRGLLNAVELDQLSVAVKGVDQEKIDELTGNIDEIRDDFDY